MASSASEDDCRTIDGARRALRYLFEVDQHHLEQALREELSNTQVCYMSHCLALFWEDSGEASSGASSLDVPDLADFQHRAGRTRRQPYSRAVEDLTATKGIRAVPSHSSQRLAVATQLLPQHRGASAAWADAQDDRDVPQHLPRDVQAQPLESEPEGEILAPAVPPQDYDAGGRTPRLQEQYDRIGNIWNRPLR